MSIRKEIRRGVGNQPRQIDAKRRERARALSSQKDLGSEFTTDAQGKLRLKADQLGLASKADVEPSLQSWTISQRRKPPRRTHEHVQGLPRRRR